MRLFHSSSNSLDLQVSRPLVVSRARVVSSEQRTGDFADTLSVGRLWLIETGMYYSLIFEKLKRLGKVSKC